VHCVAPVFPRGPSMNGVGWITGFSVDRYFQGAGEDRNVQTSAVGVRLFSVRRALLKTSLRSDPSLSGCHGVAGSQAPHWRCPV
jgi:hypothetical protein